MAYLKFWNLGQDGIAQTVCRVLSHGDYHGQGHAALTRGAEGSAHDGVGGGVNVGVGKHDGVVLRTAEALSALACGRAARRCTAQSAWIRRSPRP